jgi:hypothetical protein
LRGIEPSVEETSGERTKVFAKMDMAKARRWARLRALPIGFAIAGFVGIALMSEIAPGEEEDLYLGIGILLLVGLFVASVIIAFRTGNQIVVANAGGLVVLREYFNQAQISYLDWKEVKAVSPLGKGGLRFRRGMLATDLPGGLREMAPDGSLLPGNGSHPLLPLVLRFCPGVRLHEKLVEPLRERDPTRFHELSAQRKQGKYYLNPGRPQETSGPGRR